MAKHLQILIPLFLLSVFIACKPYSTQNDQYTKKLLIACKTGDLQTVTLLVKTGANINAERGDLGGGNFNDFPLLVAAEYGHDDIFEYLISQDASIKHLAGEAILRVASRNGRIKIVNYLLKNDVSVNGFIKDFSFTPLMEAARYNKTEIMQILISHGAIIDECDKSDLGKQETALMLAAESRNSDAIKLLIENKADVNARIINGANNYSRDSGWTALMQTFNSNIYEYSEIDHIKSIEYLIAAGADPNITDDCGCTAMDYALRNNFKKAGKYLAENGGKTGNGCALPLNKSYDKYPSDWNVIIKRKHKNE